MLTAEELKEKLRKRLTELEGHAAPEDLEDIIEEARELGMNEAQIARMVPEVDRSINWEHIRLQKEQVAAEAAIEAERSAKRQEEIAAAPQYLDAIISYSMADGIVEAEKLRVIFDKAAGLEQPLHELAATIKGLLEKGRFRPYPNADLNADGLHQVLMSTSWYTDKKHPKSKPETSAPGLSATPAEPMRILTFAVDKAEIKKGQFAKLSWSVSGKGRIDISNLGSTENLSGDQLVRPLETTRYVLTAGDSRRTADVMVKAAPVFGGILKAILWIAGAFALLCFLIAIFVPDPKQPQDPVPAVTPVEATNAPQLKVGQIGAVNLSAREEQEIVDAMNRYLRYQGEDDQKPEKIREISNQYAYPVTRYFKKRNASFAYVYNDVQRYRQKYRHDGWKIVPEDTRVERMPDGNYMMDLEGVFSYYVRNPKNGNSYREQYVHNRYVLNGEFSIRAVWEVKSGE